ncbi:hypothetical protein ATSB10_23690 [Dyella thiooxydans]|uniref:Uncharacterized protein n=1 Tax=Dyella thiooxydans TaxID=445710 RepID=A0A160N1U5_9GAMM|nr:hypothetical protein ATSB10_23690 [Dyella thiooxydans]
MRAEDVLGVWVFFFCFMTSRIDSRRNRDSGVFDTKNFRHRDEFIV